MKVDDNPFPGDQNMVDAGLVKVKPKVLTSAKSKEAGTVDPKMQISADKYREIRRRHVDHLAHSGAPVTLPLSLVRSSPSSIKGDAHSPNRDPSVHLHRFTLC